jgi:ubiquinone/menaquinone biosynthesis C-methylase UbiE
MNREDGSARNFRARVSRTFDNASPFYGFFDFFSRGVLTEAAVRLSRIVPMGPQTVILEVFCATGLFSRILARTGARMVAVDISPGMIRRAAREAGRLPIGFLVGDGADLPFSDNTFNLVVAGRGLHGMPRSVRDSVVTEIHRVSAEYVLFMEPKRPKNVLGRAVMGVLERLEGGYEDYLEFISTDFKIYLSAMGLAPRDLLLKDNEHVILCRKGR